MSWETIQRVDTKDWTGMHIGGKRGKDFQAPGKPNVKTEKAVARRTKDYMSTVSGKAGFYAPGSQNPHKVRGK